MSFGTNMEAVSPYSEELDSYAIPKQTNKKTPSKQSHAFPLLLPVMNSRNISDLLALPWRLIYRESERSVCVKLSGKASACIR